MFQLFSGAARVCLLVSATVAMAHAADVPLSDMTVVAYNETEPISTALAKLYAQLRRIPADHLIGLDCSIEEDVSREEFESTIAQPLRDEFKKRQWWTLHVNAEGKESVTATSVRFLALIKGVPLKIRPSAQAPPG